MGGAKEVKEDWMFHWFRLWHGTATDPKWRTVARRSGRTIPEVLSVWIMVLENASCNTDDRGVLARWNDEIAADSIGVDVNVITDIIAAMQGVCLDGKVLIGWNKRQPKRDDDSAERVREHRVKRSVTQCNAGVTQCNAPDTDTDSDADADSDKTQTREDAEEDKTPSRARRARSFYSTDFEEFWKLYPRRIGKGAAFKAFGRAVAKAPVAEIMAGLARFCDATIDADLKFIPHPQTWLNQERWTDDSHAIDPQGRATEANAFLDAIDRGKDGAGIRTTSYRPGHGSGNGLAAAPVVVTLSTVPAKR